jgi:serine/threonine-protein kinase
MAGVRAGDVIGGKYRVDRFLGAGNMGIVVAAHHLQLDQRVAIKFLGPAAVAEADVVKRFAREARAAAKITSEHVARVMDVGALENGAPYMVMELLEGADLAAWVRDKGPLPVALAVDFVLQVCEAIAEAHVLGIIHRDLKPANCFVTRTADGQHCVKVLDFGISKVTGIGNSLSEMSMTSTHTLLGSPLYMSPEQMMASRDVDQRTDIWSVGIILHELLTGHAPFSASSIPELCVRIATEDAPPLRVSRPDCPRALENVARKCLEKERQRRYANVAELAQALVEFGSDRSSVSTQRISRVMQHAGRQPLPTYSEGSAMGSAPHMPWARTTSRAARGKRIAVGLFVVAAAAAGTLFGVLRLQSLGAQRAVTSTIDPSAGPARVDASPRIEERVEDENHKELRPLNEPAPEAPKAVLVDRRGPGPEKRNEATAPPPLRPAARATPAIDAGSMVPQVAAPRASAVSPDCDPPVMIDRDGIKHPKPQCM